MTELSETGMAPTALVLSCLAAFLPTPAMAERSVTLQGSDCRVWDQYPDARKTIRWSGACRGNWADGPGVMTWYYDGRYDGRAEATLREGRIEGQARVQWRDGRRLDSGFQRGRASGQGTYVWPDGRVYRGEWRDDHRTGFGTLTYPNGNRYVGEFHRNRATGKGKVVTADGRNFQARIGADGKIGTGSPVDREPQSASVPPAQDGERLEDWLNGPPLPRGTGAR